MTRIEHTGAIPGEKQEQLEKAQNYYFKRKIAGMRAVSLNPETSGHLLGSVIGKAYGLSAEETEDLVAEVKKSQDIHSALATISKYLVENLDVDDYEQLQRQEFIERNGFKPLNKVWSYHIDESALYLHMGPSRTLTESERQEERQDAFANLAEQLIDTEAMQEVEIVTMTSSLLADPRYRVLIEAAGFSIIKISDPEILSDFPSRDRNRVFVAIMDSREFISRFRSSHSSI